MTHANEEDLETLLHHLGEAKSIMKRLNWRGNLINSFDDLDKKAQRALRKIYREKQARKDGDT